VLFAVWTPLVNKVFPPLPAPPASTNAVTIAAAGTNGPRISSLPSTAVLTNMLAASTNAPVGKEENITIDSDLARYDFSSIGGGIKLVELKKYLAFVGCKAEKLTNNPPAALNRKAPLPILLISSADGSLGDNVFKLSSTGKTVRAERTLTNGIVLVKEFEILTNYQVKATVRWENRGTQPARAPARELILGSATPMGAYDELRTLGVDWYDGKTAHRTDRNYFEPSKALFGLINRAGKSDYTGGESNVQWAAAHNQFFTVILTPKGGPAPKIMAHPVDLPLPSPEEVMHDARTPTKSAGVVGGLIYPEIIIPAGQSFVEEFHIYAGPKEYKTLSRMDQDADLVMNLEGFWGWFAKMLLLAMNALASLGAPYGLAIVLITVILKLVFYPVTAASTRSMKRMSTLQPQMKAIQEKYKSDPTKMNQKLQEFMKEHKINPLGSCLPLLVTIPVFAGFWKMLYSAIELRGAKFLWACDLSQPDTLVMIPGLHVPVNGFALLMIGTMMWQSHMTPPSPGVDPAQQKMMRYMPLIIVPFIYNQAAGLTLYWTVQNVLSITQMILTKDRPEKPAKPAGAAPVRRKI